MHNWKNKDGLNQQELYNELNGLLELASKEEELIEIISRVEGEDTHPIYFIMKKSNKVVVRFDFVGDDRVRYILDDGRSYRASKISNLYKNIRIGE